MKRMVGFLAAAAGLGGLAMPLQASAHDEPVVGVLAGAGIGAAIGNAPGAVVGAIIGAIGGATYAHRTDHPHSHPHPHRTGIATPPVRQPVVYAEPARYAANGSEVYYCEPKSAHHAPKVVYREPRPKTTKVAASPQMKKVCRYEPVRKTVTASTKKRPLA